jgi:hypothetical protein
MTKDQFGGLNANKVKQFFAASCKDKAKAKARGSKADAKRDAGKTVTSGAWDKPHIAEAKLTVRGKSTYGFWKFRGRERSTSTVPLLRNGRPVFRRSKVAKGAGRGFFTAGPLHQVMRKIHTWFDLGEPVLLAESRLVTRHK